jgi:hypothetical protein
VESEAALGHAGLLELLGPFRDHRGRYNAARTVDAFRARLRNEVDLDALWFELLAVVDHTVQPSRSSLWLRPSTQEPRRPAS